MREGGFRLPILQDPNGAIAARYAVTGVPTTIAIDSNGRVVSRKIGENTRSAASPGSRR